MTTYSARPTDSASTASCSGSMSGPGRLTHRLQQLQDLQEFVKRLNATSAAVPRDAAAGAREPGHDQGQQINGCAVCVDMHTKDAEHDGETSGRLSLVARARRPLHRAGGPRSSTAHPASPTPPAVLPTRPGERGQVLRRRPARRAGDHHRRQQRLNRFNVMLRTRAVTTSPDSGNYVGDSRWPAASPGYAGKVPCRGSSRSREPGWRRGTSWRGSGRKTSMPFRQWPAERA